MCSPKRSRNQNRGGFTLTELMITVALIGVLAAIAVPNFLSYQARTRRSESYSNLAGIARAYKVYHADQGRFPDMIASTSPPAASLPAGPPTAAQMEWDTPTETFFKMVGWRPDGNVYYSYSVNSQQSCTGGCNDQLCFTLTAYGDVDNDGSIAAVMYAHPLRDNAGNVIGECPDGVLQTLFAVHDSEPVVNYDPLVDDF